MADILAPVYVTLEIEKPGDRSMTIEGWLTSTGVHKSWAIQPSAIYVPDGVVAFFEFDHIRSVYPSVPPGMIAKP